MTQAHRKREPHPTRKTRGVFVVLFCCLATTLVFPLDPRLHITQYTHRIFGSEAGLPQNTVTAMAQTPDGYLWVGTQEGLARFDGVHFETFDNRTVHAIRENYITALQVTADGSLWIGSHGGGMCRYRNGHFESFGKSEGLTSPFIRKLYSDPAGTLWVGTQREGPFHWNGTRFLSPPWAGKLPEGPVEDFASGPNGILWLAIVGAGVVQVQNGSVRLLATPEGLTDLNVLTLACDREGTLWAGTRSGKLYRLDHGHFQETPAAPESAGRTINAILPDRDGNLWVAHTSLGLARRHQSRWEVFGKSEGLSATTPCSLFEDREGNLWVGTFSGGLNQFHAPRFRCIGVPEGLSEEFMTTVFQDSRGGIWCGTHGAGAFRIQDDRVEHVPAPEASSEGIVRAFCEDRDGTVWMGTLKGLYRIRGGRAEPSSLPPEALQGIILSLTARKEGGLWIGMSSGLYIFQGGEILPFTPMKTAVGTTPVLAIHPDRKGALWIATDGKGVVRIQDGKAHAFTRKEGFPADGAWFIHEDREGTLWFATYDAGIVQWNGRRFAGVTRDQGLFDNLVFQILEDDCGFFWMGCNRGIFRARKNEIAAVMDGRHSSITCDRFDTADGLRSKELSGGNQEAGFRSKDGLFWFPTIRGIASIDPCHIPLNRIPPDVSLEQMVANGRNVALIQGIELEADCEQLEFRFTAPSFVQPSRIRFQYRMFGLDKAWTDAGNRRAAYYTSFPPGDFQLEIRACNEDGIWSRKSATFRFRHRPHFYQTPLFYFLSALAAFLLLVGVHFVRIRRLKAHQRELARLVEERTASLRHQTEQTEDARKEAERQRELALQANQLKTDLLHLVVHDLKNPLSGVIGFTDLMRMELKGNTHQEANLDSISRATSHMLRLVESLLSIAALESGSLELMSKEVNLSQIAASSARNFSGAARNKNQTILLEVEAGCTLWGDPARLEEVVDNLVSNAVKYSPRGAPILIRVSRNRPEPGKILLEVIDQGPGLTASDTGRLFGKFQKLSAKPTGNETSSGLGLSLVKLLVELHGGRVWAESCAGQGSTFCVEFPFWSPEVQGDPSRSTPSDSKRVSAFRDSPAED